MPEYDFRSLSPYDFQLLSRDLLQAELDLRLESFSHGRDGGIDLRNIEEELIVQCKHFLDSPYETLLRVLKRDERPKVDKLQPQRYMLTTSQGLVPARKTEIQQVFAPYCQSPDDVLGRDDLNNLLGHHRTIEEQHFKLWLTSDIVLRRIIQAGALEDTERAVERMRTGTRRYVQNPSFRRALDILEKRHNCIIAGIPGIGKTTLAEVLLVHYVDRHDFVPIRIGYDLSETIDRARTAERQIFYFDDFLGTTTLDKLKKNEDQRLVEFMLDVADNPRWRFILTTREYILNRARLRYESLSNLNLDLETCVLGLGDYTAEARAAILYNHIYFSDIGNEFKRELLRSRAYRQIAFHTNYSPRIVEHMTAARHLAGVSPGAYGREFVAALDNPSRIWRHAFEEQLSPASQQLLMVLASLPDEVLLADTENAYSAFIDVRRARRGFQSGLRDFHNALQEMDGNFISTSRIGDNIVIRFHNPSVEDFLRYYLSQHSADVQDLLRSAIFFEQCLELARGSNDTKSEAAFKNIVDLDAALRRLVETDTCRLIRQSDGEKIIGVRHWQPPMSERAENVVEIAELMDNDRLRALARELVQKVKQEFELAGRDREACTSLARTIIKKTNQTDIDKGFVATMKRTLLEDPKEIDDFRGIVRLKEADSTFFSMAELRSTAKRFIEFCQQEANAAMDENDADTLNSLAYALTYVSEALQVTKRTKKYIDTIKQRAAQLAEPDEQDPEPEEDWDDSTDIRFNIDDMFDGLLHDMESLE
jgi:hypothetical protein